MLSRTFFAPPLMASSGWISWAHVAFLKFLELFYLQSSQRAFQCSELAQLLPPCSSHTQNQCLEVFKNMLFYSTSFTLRLKILCLRPKTTENIPYVCIRVREWGVGGFEYSLRHKKDPLTQRCLRTTSAVNMRELHENDPLFLNKLNVWVRLTCNLHSQKYWSHVYDFNSHKERKYLTSASVSL